MKGGDFVRLLQFAGCFYFILILSSCWTSTGTKTNPICPCYYHSSVSFVEATCDTPERKISVCNKCGSVTEQVLSPALGCNFVTEKVILEATCETPGLILQKCSNCNRVREISYEVDSCNSQWQVKKVPTINSGGILIYICEHNRVFQQKYLPYLNSEDYTCQLMREPTSDEHGVMRYIFEWEEKAFVFERMFEAFVPNSSSSEGLEYTYFDDEIIVCGMGSCTDDDVIIPDGVTEIGESAFKYQTIKSIKLPNSLKVIGRSAFYANPSLESIIIPDSVEIVEPYAFSDCYALKKVEIGKMVREISYEVLEGCKNIDNIIVDEGNTFFDSRNNCNAVIETETNKLIIGTKNTNIPETVVELAPYSFAYLPITFAVIPDTVLVAFDAFAYCDYLESIVIGSGISYLSRIIVWECRNLKSVYYMGSEQQWNTFEGNAVSTQLGIMEYDVYFYSAEEPTVTNKFWHYDWDGQIVLWEVSN